MAGVRLVRAFGEQHPSAVFVEVGANDGEQHDHLRPLIRSLDWHGLMVEPVPYVFERLQRNYADLARVTCVNAAIADRDGELPFHFLRDAPPEERAGLPDWYDGVGSFSRDTILSHADAMPDIADRLVTRPVRAMTFETLCSEHGLDRLDLLLIDTEGHDWAVLRTIDLARRHPRLLVYEHYHLSAEDREAALEHVRAAGYEVLEEGFDTFCLDPTPDDALTATWRRLRPAIPGVARHEEVR